jgi:signal transduction histidine kinase
MITLESSHLFGHLSAEDLEALRKDVKELTYAKGEEIFREGDPGDGAYVVRSGAVDIEASLAGEQRQVFCRVLPGDVFGEMTLLDQHPRSACAVAAEDAVLYFVPREPLVELLKRSPDLAITLVQEISKRLREFNRLYITKVLEAERMALIGRFASAIVHDLKNPLTIIGIAAQSASRESATMEARKTAETRITKQVDRITNLVNDILEFTRGAHKSAPLYRTDYGEFIAGLIAEISPDLEPKRVTLQLEAPPPEVALALNPKRLSRVFFNLIHNAVDAMPSGGVIRLRIEVNPDAKEVVTEIRDEGEGIAPEIMPQIFEAFATFGKAKGTGLGLAITLRIIEEHGGRIIAGNHPKGGAVFTITLPM